MNTNETEVLKGYPDVLTAKMVAEILGIGYVNALRVIRYGDVNYIKIGNVYKMPKKSFLEWLHAAKNRELKFDN